MANPGAITFGEFYDDVRPLIVQRHPGAWTTYRPYFERMRAEWGDLPIIQIDPLLIETGAVVARTSALERRSSRGGVSAEEHYIAAARHIFGLALRRRVIESNPALLVAKPRRPANVRQALKGTELEAMGYALLEHSNDPALDILLVRFHLETGARRMGALGLRVQDLEPVAQALTLSEKNGGRRRLPTTAGLIPRILELRAARLRPEQPTGAAFLQLSGRPLTRRRYNYIADIWAKHIEGMAGRGVSIHWLRHTAITRVERYAGFAIAAEFAGHQVRPMTGTYTKANFSEVAKAVCGLAGEVHPVNRASSQKQK